MYNKVNADGSVSDVSILRGIGGGCDEEAVRVIKLTSKKWKPGKQSGKASVIQMILPIKFKI